MSKSGFILTRHWRDTSQGIEIVLWLTTSDGPLKVRLTGQQAVGFAAEDDAAAIREERVGMPGIELRPLALKTFAQMPVIGVYATQYRTLLALERRLKTRGITLYECDVRPPERYLMERFLTAAVDISGGEPDAGALLNPRLTPDATYRPVLQQASIDIETSAYGDLYSVAIDGCGQRQVFMLGTAPAGVQPEQDFRLTWCQSRREIIASLNAWFAQYDPDVVVGWNVVQFDLRILQQTADAQGLAFLPGRGQQPLDWRETRGERQYLFATLPGRLICDGIDALKAALWTFPSFSLENVARKLLGEGKDIGADEDKMAEIERRFQQDRYALARYNLQDCVLVNRIFAKTQLLDFIVERACVTGLQADHFGGSIAAFDHHYLPRMHRAGYIAENIGERSGPSFPGGYVMDSKPGLYDSVIVLDYKSLYPSIIRTFLVDPVGLIEGEIATDPATVVSGINGTTFSRHAHCLPEIVTQLWQKRDAAKQVRNEALSRALKLLMNSFCGVLGSPDCRFFNPRLVSAVTLRGHDMMRTTRDLVEAQGYDVIYGDTDSIFVWLKKDCEDDEARALAAQLTAHINAWWRATLKSTLALESHLDIEFDTHYRRFFMPTIRGTEQGSKKRYAGLVAMGTAEEEIVYRGLESARSDWTPLAQQFQQGLFERIFKGQPYQQYVRDYVARTLQGEHDSLLVYRKRLRQRLDAYQVNVPPQVRAARLADAQRAATQRPLRYQHGGWISYLMTVNGPEPQEYRNAPVDYQHYLLKQLQPVADAILSPLGDSFHALTTSQQNLF